MALCGISEYCEFSLAQLFLRTKCFAKSSFTELFRSGRTEKHVICVDNKKSQESLSSGNGVEYPYQNPTEIRMQLPLLNENCCQCGSL